jgi:hypothetical protein
MFVISARLFGSSFQQVRTILDKEVTNAASLRLHSFALPVHPGV